MASVDGAPRALAALEVARLNEGHEIAVALQAGQVVGVLGEGEVGKTTTIRQALGPGDEQYPVVDLDLDGVAGDEHLAFQIARKVAVAVLGAPGFSTLKVGVLVPASLEPKRIELAELLAVDGLEEALRDWPSGTYELERALTALEQLAQRRNVVLWIDHLEAPALTPRHPLDLERLLWAIRAMAQRQPSLGIVLSGRDQIEDRVLGREAAFYEQGRWLTLDNPPPETWREVARALQVPAAAADELSSLTRGHPEATLLALLEVATGTHQPRNALTIVWDVAAGSGGLTGRAMQHARSLHRLGGQVMTQVARGEAPYGNGQRGKSPPQEIRKVLGRLRMAGLIRHDGAWSIVNPLIGIVLRGDVTPLSAPDRESGVEALP
ncbi:MAG TPA: hypothetical protein VFJ57_01905 [Solirubrobacterales bacterium]|nr:hypothetical protein [Solirubrobacterales bacterium]